MSSPTLTIPKTLEESTSLYGCEPAPDAIPVQVAYVGPDNASGVDTRVACRHCGHRFSQPRPCTVLMHKVQTAYLATLNL